MAGILHWTTGADSASTKLSPIKQAESARTWMPGSRNTPQPHIIKITFPADQESQLDIGSAFLLKFPADERSTDSILTAAEHCQLLCVLRGSNRRPELSKPGSCNAHLKPH